MSRFWSDFSSTDDEALYSESFNLEEELSSSNEEERLKAAIYHLVDDLESQKTLISQLKQRENTMRGEIACLKEQLCIERRIHQKAEYSSAQVSKKEFEMTQTRAEDGREKALEKELAAVKMLREKDREAFNRAANDREKALEKELAEVKKQNIKIYKLSTELEKTKEELKISEDLKESFMKEAVEMKEQMFAKAAEVQTLKDKTTAQIQLQQKWELEKKTLLNKLQTMKAENKHVQSELEASQDEIHDQMKIIEGLEQIAEQDKMSHEKVLEGFLKEKALLVRNIQDRDRFINQLISKNKRETSGFLDKIAKLEVEHNQEVERQKIETQKLATKLEQIEDELKNTKESNTSLIKEIAEGKKEIICKKTEVEALTEKASTMAELQRKSDHQINTLSNRLQDMEAEKQNVSKQLLDLAKEFRAITEKIKEKTAEMEKETEQLQTQIKDTEKNAALESQRWSAEKHGLLEEFQSKLEAKEDEKQALIKKTAELEEMAKKEKASLMRTIDEAMEVENELKKTLTRKEEERQLHFDVVRALEQELERKRRKWYQKLLCH